VDNSRDGVDLATAADRLGLAAATVRKRLQRGTIKGFKAADGTWRVVLDRVDSSQDKVDNGLDSPGQDDGPLVAGLRDEVHFLRSQIQAQAQAHNDALQG
jgi:hypothetical protein